MHIRDRQRGASLVELIIFIVIVSVGLAGVLAVFSATAAKSADPVVRKQALAIAESLVEEISLMPFTYCDPDDPAAATATSTAGCATPETLASAAADAATSEPGETRYSTTTPFDNVNDYHRFAMTGITDLAGNAVPGLEDYSASVTVTRGGLGFTDPDDVALIAVTVTGPGRETVTLSGYRVRYAPNALP